MAIDIESQVGKRVRITSQVLKGEGSIAASCEGVLLGAGTEKTGSWYAHSKDKKLWLQRVELLLDSGERRVCNLDQNTFVEVLS